VPSGRRLHFFLLSIFSVVCSVTTSELLKFYVGFGYDVVVRRRPTCSVVRKMSALLACLMLQCSL